MDSPIHRHYSSRVIRRCIPSLVLLIVLASGDLHADSVTILFDASYSLSLQSDGHTRIDRLRDELDSWMSEQPLSTRYALLVGEHRGDVTQRLPYPATSRQVSLALREVAPWGAVDLLRAIERAASTASAIAIANDESHVTLLLVTDGEDIAALMPPRPLRLPENVVFEAIALPSTSPASVHPMLDTLAERHELRMPDTDSPPGPAAEPSRVPRAEQPSAQGESSLLVRWARAARWVFSATLLLGLIALAKALWLHRRRLAVVERHNSRPPILELDMRGPIGRSTARVATYPCVLAADTGVAPLELVERDSAIVVRSGDTIRINGVRRTEHPIEVGDQIRCGTTRVIVREVARTKPVRAPRPRHRRYAVAPAVAAAAAILAFVLAAPSDATTAPSRATSPPLPAASQQSQPETTQTLPTLALPAVIGPADPLPQVRLDYLAFHAHPDDEALDFGALLARLHARGLSGAVVIMTDGESGLDQHPWREVDEIYPDYRLTGTDLAGVRIEEAREAVGWLGSSYYLRLGLPNHPYNTWLDELAPLEVIERWGGAQHLVSRIEGIIAHFQPRVVISPDGPGPALEHFEHQATGILVARAVDRIFELPGDSLEAHIVAVDPLQPSGYENLIRVSPWTPEQDGTVPRLRQLFALRAHRTQRDATVIGVETRLTLPYDYVLVRKGRRDIVSRLFGDDAVNGLSDSAQPRVVVPREDLTEHR